MPEPSQNTKTKTRFRPPGETCYWFQGKGKGYSKSKPCEGSNASRCSRMLRDRRKHLRKKGRHCCLANKIACKKETFLWVLDSVLWAWVPNMNLSHQVSLRKSRIEMLEIAEQERNALEKDKQELLLGGRDGSSSSFLSPTSLCQDDLSPAWLVCKLWSWWCCHVMMNVMMTCWCNLHFDETLDQGATHQDDPKRRARQGFNGKREAGTDA